MVRTNPTLPAAPRGLAAFLVAGAVGAMAAGCTCDYMVEAREVYSAGDYQQAHALVTALVEEGGQDAHLYQLEQGSTALAVDRPAEAVKAWRDAGLAFWDNEGGSFFGETMTWLTDETAAAYRGSAYERILLRAMQFLGEKVTPGLELGDDTFAYVLQMLEEQQRIREELGTPIEGENGEVQLVPPGAEFKYVAIGNYLGSAEYEERLDMGEARRQLEMALGVEPDNPWLQSELERIETGGFAAQGNGVLRVVGLVGRAPFKVEESVPNTDALRAIASIVMVIETGRLSGALFSEIPIDALRRWGDNPEALEVRVDGATVGPTRVVTDVEAVAEAEYAATLQMRTVRALIRRALKFGITEGAAAGADAITTDSEPWVQAVAQIGVFLFGWMWTASECPDLRCWSLLPASYQVLRYELPPGRHEIEVVPLANGGYPSGVPRRAIVTVSPGRTTWVLANFPTRNGGSPLLSRSIEPVSGPEVDGGTGEQN